VTEDFDADGELGTAAAALTAQPIPRSPRISPPDVFQAADALLIEGHKPTIDRVRMRIGRGSPNTIQEHLEVWWTHLGSRLRDVPGREFPELPERVALSLQKLWNEALDSAHEALGEKISTRERTLAEREAALIVREQQFIEQERTALARATALEESVALAREQLLASNQRADRLEASLEVRAAEVGRLQARMEALTADTQDLRARHDAAAAAHQAERTQMDERHAANEARWLVEIDRGRQGAKEAARDYERQVKELRAQITQLQSQRDELKRDLQQARAELRTAVSLRAQAERRLAAIMLKAVKAARTAQSKSAASRSTPRKPPR
jgi:chromosome segregation ATPase